MDALKVLSERGLVYQMTDEERLGSLLSSPPVTFYVGFDATADSLHLGHLVPLMAAAWLQRAGHRPIILVGGATALVGDPTGRSSERTLEQPETVRSWAGSISTQLKRFLDFGPGGALLVDNADWLSRLNYIDFLRDVGSRFSVNRMLTADSVRMRLEKGLSFLEFNYMLLQAYDFLWLYRNHGCSVQIGGADQWGNIVAGIDLVRRVEAAEVYGLTCPLVTSSTGEKMSKSMPGGAVWLDAERTSPYDYYQFWMNVDDHDAIYFLKLYTFVPAAEIEAMSALEGADTRLVKRRLAREATSIVHGEAEAARAEAAAAAIFSGEGDGSGIPTLEVPAERLAAGLSWTDLFVETGLCPSRSEARRLARQGGLGCGSVLIGKPDDTVSEADTEGGSLLLRAGKKRFHRVSFTH
jgi:tyrosyl-tRNA synthetase